jgi:tetratricopeptide (TPR) repeat protein
VWEEAANKLMILRRTLLLISCLVLLGNTLTGCVYFNTFYNAKKEFNQAEKYRKQSGTGSQSNYKNAIEKSLKVIEDHPNSKYYDDALYVVAASYYHTQQYSKAERRFRELLANYPDSKFAKQSMVYLAQAKLKLSDHDAAIELFEEIFAGDYDKSYKADAAMELGLYHIEEKEPERARGYFLSVRDSLGNETQKLTAQQYIADSYFEGFNFADALKAYLQVLGMKPNKDVRYHAMQSAAICSYRLQRINDGLDYLKELAKDEIYYDSLGGIQLTMALGYEYAGDLPQAEVLYDEVASKSGNNNWVTEANYQLGLIYQFDYDDLPTAKEYYDKAIRGNQSLESGKDALQRSADIAKLQMIESKQKANREAAEKAKKEAEAKKADTSSTGPGVLVDSTGTSDSAGVVIDSAKGDSLTVDSLFANVPTTDSAPQTPITAINTPDTTASDSTSRTVVVIDSTQSDTAKDSTVALDSIAADSALVDSLMADSLRTDSLAVDSLRTDSLAGDSLLTDSTRTDTTAALSEAEKIAKQSQALKALSTPAPPAKKVPTKAEQARLDSLSAERTRLAELEANADIIFQLAELYWFQLNKPDSAIEELRGLIRDYPNTSFAPRAMLALSTMYREQLSDSVGADSILQLAYEKYGKTDYATEIIKLMNKAGTAEDRGYPEYYYHLAEDFLIDSSNADSARYYYQYVVDSFPNSSLAPQARFNTVWILENYQSPGDSSVIFAYQEIIDSFPGTPQAQEAGKRLAYKAPVKKQYVTPDADRAKEGSEKETKPGEVMVAKSVSVEQADSTGRYVDPKERIYKGPKGEQLILLDIKPIETRVEFDYPPEASSVEGYQFELYFQILLDFSGRIVEYVLKSPAPHDEINRRAEKTVESMAFDPLQINSELTRKSEMITLPEDQEDPRGRWYVYKFIVEKPDYLK